MICHTYNCGRKFLNSAIVAVANSQIIKNSAGNAGGGVMASDNATIKLTRNQLLASTDKKGTGEGIGEITSLKINQIPAK